MYMLVRTRKVEMFSLTLFNVGHGFCAYATTPGTGNLLFDCGYDYDLQFYPSRYFKDRNIRNISELVLSHFDQDHVANIASLREVVTFGVLTRNPSVPVEFVRSEKQRIGQVTAAMESALQMHRDWTEPVTVWPDYGGVKITHFWNSYPTFTDMNNLSLVTFLYYDGCGIVIPGDLEGNGWSALLKQELFRQCLRETNIFIASHHGRNEGYCEEVFKCCSPHIVLLSDKSIVHDSQEHDYAKHASGVEWLGECVRYVLTTRRDGHIRIDKEKGQHAVIHKGVSL
jgi:beta-lactamase superfamily II metal-dependent hydrolase